MNIRMRGGVCDVNGQMIKMSLSPVRVAVGSVYQTLRGEWKTVAAEYGKFEMNDGAMFGYETRPATEAEIAAATAPVDVQKEKEFWSEFGNN